MINESDLNVLRGGLGFSAFVAVAGFAKLRISVATSRIVSCMTLPFLGVFSVAFIVAEKCLSEPIDPEIW